MIQSHYWCPEQDSNLHDLSAITPSTLRVYLSTTWARYYQFYHNHMEQATGFEPVLKPWQGLVLTVKHHACVIGPRDRIRTGKACYVAAHFTTYDYLTTFLQTVSRVNCAPVHETVTGLVPEEGVEPSICAMQLRGLNAATLPTCPLGHSFYLTCFHGPSTRYLS